jgi:hypothetical protein
MQQGSEDVKLVVRTINSAAFTTHDWEEYVVTVSSYSHILNQADPLSCLYPHHCQHILEKVSRYAEAKSNQGPYHYTTQNKASWYWSRTWGATKRLACTHWVLTDWKRWVFGTFNESRTHGFVSPIIPFDAQNPSILQALLYWSR